MRRYLPFAPLTAAFALALILTAARGAQAQDAAAGAKVFNQCKSCHVVAAGAKSTLGPNLFGVVGRAAASVDGFRYSPSMKEKAAGGLVWNDEKLRAYLINPKAVVPGTNMSFAGLKNEQQVTDLLAYIGTLK